MSTAQQKAVLMILLCGITVLYWITANTFNVYSFALVGALFEILWLPMLLMLFGLPLICFVFWVREKFKLRSVYLLLFLTMLALAIVFNLLR